MAVFLNGAVEDDMAHFTRREFLKTGLAAGTLAVSGAVLLGVQRGSATDLVTLGRSGVKVTRLAFGTGTFSGQVQRELGQEGFTRLVRHAYDRGIRFFETAESYGEMHRMLGVALKGIPRDSYQIMSKVTTREGVDPQQKFDELRRLANTEYFDIMLLHWQHTATWPADTARWQDGILEAQSKKVVVSHGASVHGLPALRQVPGNKWLHVAMIRMNHTGKSMDAEDYATQGPGNVPEVVTHVKEVRTQGMGVISMKLAGEGTFDREDRQKAMRFAFRNAGVDCVTVGTRARRNRRSHREPESRARLVTRRLARSRKDQTSDMATKLTSYSACPVRTAEPIGPSAFDRFRGSSASSSVAASGRKSHEARSVRGGSLTTGPIRSP